MSLTNQEMLKIFQTASKLHDIAGAVYPERASSEDSFFQDRNDLKLFGKTIFEYSFDNPVQLRDRLTEMWKYQDAEYMKQFVNICLVAAFKYKTSLEKPEQGISAFIYEF